MCGGLPRGGDQVGIALRVMRLKRKYMEATALLLALEYVIAVRRITCVET